MGIDIEELFRKPLFWSILAAFIVTTINFFLFLINRKTFRLLYEKPQIRINSVSLKQPEKDMYGNLGHGSFIDLTVINPSTFNNRILSRKLIAFPFGSLILNDNVNFEVPPFSLKAVKIAFDYESNIKNHNKIALITLTDIKQRKIRKILKLSETN